MNRCKLFLLTFFMLVFVHSKFLYGQSQMQVPSGMPVGVSPDDKALGGTAVGEGLNGFSDAGLFTGAMDIKIPIFSFDKSFGVSLDYNTKGIMVDEFASRLGLHWSLNDAGASIIRVVHDIPDELFMNNDSLIPIEYTVNGKYIDTFIVNNEMHIYGRIATYKEGPVQLNAANAYKDSSSDEFIVSLNGFTFKFFIGKDLRIYTTSSQNIKVQLLQNNIPVSNVSEYQLAVGGLSFLISDTKGNKYYFQPAASEMTLFKDKFQDWSETDDIFVPSQNSVYLYGFPTKWKIEHIELANGGFINFKYATSPDLKNKYVSGHQTMAYDNYYVRESPSSYYLGQNEIKPAEPDGPITEIDYPGNVQVHFQYDSQHWNAKGDYFLNEIKISSGDNCKRFQFRVNQDAVNKRYYLDSILQVSCDGAATEPYYRFAYNPIIDVRNISLPGYPPVYDTERAILPRRLNPGQDLYGYYNGDSVGVAVGSSGNGISVPQHNPGSGTNYGNERQYAAEYAQAGLLTMMKNAYGEVEHLYYGPNVINSVPLATLGKIPSDNNFIGTDQPDGVRIDSIIKTDTAHSGQKVKTVFLYSDGQLFMPGGYFHYPEYIDSATNDWDKNIFQSYFLTPHQMIEGANHGYSSVGIKNYVNDTLLSHRLITYTNMQDDLTGPEQTRYFKVSGSKDYFQFPYTDKQYLKDWEFGLPLTVTDYDQNDRIIKKVINHYDFSAPDSSASSFVTNTNTVRVSTGTVLYFPGGYSGGFFPYYLNQKVFTDSYYPFKGKATLARTVTRKYISDTRFVTDTVWYTYDDHNNLSGTVTQNSDGGKTATEMVYNYDVDGPQYATGHPGYTAHPGTTLYNMSDSGLEVPVSTERWKLLPGTTITDPYGGTVLQNNNQLLNAYITGYRYQDGKLWTSGLWNTQTGSPLGYTGYTGLGSGVSGNPYGKVLSAYNTTGPVEDLINTSQVTLFDAKGNPLETQLLGQDQYKAMIWDTAGGQKLAEAANCRYSDIAYTSFENSLPEGNLAGSQPDIIASAGAVTGSHVGLLWTQTSPGTAVTFSGTQNLQAGKPYVLSFWVYGATPSLKVGSQVIPVSSASLVYTKGSWHNYQVRFTPASAGKITITGTAALSQVDEIRLFPADAQMQSRTYEPLFGQSSQTGPSGRVTYYQYDAMGRQDLVIDQDGNILSKTDYHVAQ